MIRTGPSRARFLACALLLSCASASSHCGDKGSWAPLAGSLRASASTADGFLASLGLDIGDAKASLRIAAEPGAAPSLLAGWSGPLLAAGPVRHKGLAQMLCDPCADAYLFGGAWYRPVALDFDSARRGFFLGESAGIWALGGWAPRLGAWAGSVGDAGPLFGCAAACSILPAQDGFDTWFSEEPAVSRRLLIACLAWVGFGWPCGKILAAVAQSEEDFGERGWSARVEADGRCGGFRWSGRFSCASPDWKGLGGQGADCWEFRTDASWLLPSRTRLEGRLRAGVSEEGIPDWEALARAAWAGKVWRLEAELEGSDSETAPFCKLKGCFHADYEAKSIRVLAWSSCSAEGGVLSRVELSGALRLDRAGFPRFLLDGAGRWTAEAVYWKADARLELPAAAGSYAVRLASGDWTRAGRNPLWELAFELRARVRKGASTLRF